MVEAERYQPAPDLAAVSCFFNPAGYAAPLQNFHLFAAKLAQSGVPLFAVECSFDGRFALSGARVEHLLQVRSETVLFQKERLLNLAIAALPARFTKVAWLDADVLFTNPRWPLDTSAALDHTPIAQLWERGYRLPPGRRHFDGEGRAWTSFSATCRDHQDAHLWRNYDEHGHTGFAWAAQRALLERHTLYAHAIGGNADHLIAHAVFGDWASSCVRRLLGVSTPSAAHFRRWARAFHADVGDRLACVPGDVLHLWHGDLVNRRYLLRAKELLSFDYDPDRDVAPPPGGALEWASDKQGLHRWASSYFAKRREDGG